MTTALRLSQVYAPTLKEDPVEAEVASHRFLLRAGFIRKAAAGIYTFLPLGWRAVRKIEQIVREEMDAIGSQEMLMPIVQPAELWQESGRWTVYGPELARLRDRQGREFCLGPTHEEIITATVRGELRSYKELPQSLYQINTKFRDELRPRFGLLRGREFIMKDAYSFHASFESLQEHYDAMAGAYGRICDRLGLNWRAVAADAGQIGGSVTTEFMALADSGEAALVYCDCGWAADVEAAECLVAERCDVREPTSLTRVSTPNMHTIAQVAEALACRTRDVIKTMVARDASGQLVYLCVPGDRQLNELKAEQLVNGLHLLEEEELAEAGLPKGSLGPMNIPAGARVFADRSLQANHAWIIGANEDGYHVTGACPERDFTVDEWADLIVAQAQDRCPACGKALKAARGIEVSQVFQLGTKYSAAMGATYTDESGAEQPFIMGCYGVGITRSLAAVVEQHHDERGIMWPLSIAPAEVAILPLATDDAEVVLCAEGLWSCLAERGAEVVIDDRDERPGVKFADADLIGWPVQVIVGRKNQAAGVVEMKDRRSGERTEIPVNEAVDYIVHMLTVKRLEDCASSARS